MGNLAVTYSKQGRHQDAMALQESVLRLFRRLPPQDDAVLGTRNAGADLFLRFDYLAAGRAISNLASSYEQLGRYQDSFALREEALEIFRRSLPDDDPEIGKRLISIIFVTVVLTGDGFRVQGRP